MFMLDSWNETIVLLPKLEFEEIQIVCDLIIAEKQRVHCREVTVFHKPANFKSLLILSDGLVITQCSWCKCDLTMKLFDILSSFPL